MPNSIGYPMEGAFAAQAARNDKLRVENDTKQLEINKGALNKGLMELELERDKFQREAIDKNAEMLDALGADYQKIIANIGKPIPVGGVLDIQLRKLEKSKTESLVLQGLTPEAAAEQAAVFSGRIRESANTRNLQKLGPGDQLVDANKPGSEPLATVPSNPTNRDAQIANLMRQGFGPETAANIADGNVDIKVDQQNGRILLINKVNNTARELRIGKADEQQPGQPPSNQPPPSQDTPPVGNQGRFNPRDAVGAFSVVRALISKSVGQASDTLTDEAAENARTALTTIRERVINAFEKGGKTSLEEQKRILSALPTTGMLNNPETLVSNFKIVQDQLREVLKRDLVNADNPSLQSRIRLESQSRALELGIIIDLMNQFVPVELKDVKDAFDLPSGTIFIDPATKDLRLKK